MTQLSDLELDRAESLALFRLQTVVRNAFAVANLPYKDLADSIGESVETVKYLLSRPEDLTIQMAACMLRGMGLLLTVGTEPISHVPETPSET